MQNILTAPRSLRVTLEQRSMLRAFVLTTRETLRVPPLTADADDYLSRIRGYRQRLLDIYDNDDSYTEGDDLATTFDSCGVVLLSSALAGRKDHETIANITRLSRPFITLVLKIMDEIDFFQSETYQDLIAAIENMSGDDRAIVNAVHAALEEFWDTSWDPIVATALELLRDGQIVALGKQWWIDTESNCA